MTDPSAVTDAAVRAAAAADDARCLRAIVDHVPAAICAVDRDGRLRLVNAEAARRFGCPAADALGRTLRELLGEAGHVPFEAPIAAALRGETTRFEYGVTVDGETRHYRCDCVPDIDAQGEVRGAVTISFDVSESHATQRELELLARVDALTGLPNRRQFEDRFEEAMRRTRRTMRPMAVMFIDLDHLKVVNDAHGAAAGDAVLREFARRLKACVRATDTVARLAGDEFVLLLEGVDGVLELRRLADKVLAAVRPRFAVADPELDVTCSMGVTIYRGGAQAGSDVLALADGALNQAKKLGRNRFALA